MFSAVDTEVKTMGWKMQSFPWKKFCRIWPISFDMHQESYFHGRLRISQLLWHVTFWFIWRLERNDTPGQKSVITEWMCHSWNQGCLFLSEAPQKYLSYTLCFCLDTTGLHQCFPDVCVCVYAKSLQLCLTLCNPRDCSPSGSCVHGILQARMLEWVAMPSSRGSSWPKEQTCVSCIVGGFFTVWAKVLNVC